MKGWHIMRDGDGTAIYFGRERGAPFAAWSLTGFDGWSSSKWLPGGWAFFTPHIHFGRLFTDRKGRWYQCRVLLPQKPVGRYRRWKWNRADALEERRK